MLNDELAPERKKYGWTVSGYNPYPDNRAEESSNAPVGPEPVLPSKLGNLKATTPWISSGLQLDIQFSRATIIIGSIVSGPDNGTIYFENAY